MTLYYVRKVWIYCLAILKYIFIKLKYVILTRISYYTLGANKWSRDYRFSLDIVESIKLTYETIFCEKLGMSFFDKIFRIS